VRLSLERSDYFAVSTAGTVAQTFLSYISVRVSEVIDAADPAGSAAQYASLSFALNDAFSPNPAIGVVPPASVRAGRGTTRADALMSAVCIAPPPPGFAALLAQPCGPRVATCVPSPAATLADRFVTVNVPLLATDGGRLFDLGNASAAAATTVFVELVVSVVDAAGVPATTTLSAAVPVMLGGVNTWCLAQVQDPAYVCMLCGSNEWKHEGTFRKVPTSRGGV
jgi:hypothetical protein